MRSSRKKKKREGRKKKYKRSPEGRQQIQEKGGKTQNWGKKSNFLGRPGVLLTTVEKNERTRGKRKEAEKLKKIGCA